MKFVGVLENFNPTRGFGFIRREVDGRVVEYYFLHASKIVAGGEFARRGGRVFFEVDPSYVPKGDRYPWAHKVVVDGSYATGAAELAIGLPSEVSDEQ